MKKKKRVLIRENSIQTKLAVTMGMLLLVALCVNLFVFAQINSMVRRIDSVFSSNVDHRRTVRHSGIWWRTGCTKYLSTKSSAALEDYYRYEQDYRELLQELNNENVGQRDQDAGEKYPEYVGDLSGGKRDRRCRPSGAENVERYKSYFEEETQLYAYINSYIYDLNNLQFRAETPPAIRRCWLPWECWRPSACW